MCLVMKASVSALPLCLTAIILAVVCFTVFFCLHCVQLWIKLINKQIRHLQHVVYIYIQHTGLPSLLSRFSTETTPRKEKLHAVSPARTSVATSATSHHPIVVTPAFPRRLVVNVASIYFH